MKILVDADSCPIPVRDIIIRASQKRNIPAYFISAQELKLPKYPTIHAIQVIPGEDSADKKILNKAEKCDVIITRDVPLARLLVRTGSMVIGDRGEEYTASNIPSCSVARHANYPRIKAQYKRKKTYSQKNIQNFASTFDKVLSLQTNKERA